MLVICSVNCFVGFAVTEFYGEKTETSCKSIAYVRDIGSYVMHDDDTHLTASSQDNTGKSVPEYLRSGFYQSWGDGGVMCSQIITTKKPTSSFL